MFVDRRQYGHRATIRGPASALLTAWPGEIWVEASGGGGPHDLGTCSNGGLCVDAVFAIKDGMFTTLGRHLVTNDLVAPRALSLPNHWQHFSASRPETMALL